MALHDLLPQTAICWAGTRAVPCIPIRMSFRDSTSRCLTGGCARREKNFVPGAGSGVHRTTNGIMLHLSSSFRNDRAPDVQVCALAPHRGQYDRPDV